MKTGSATRKNPRRTLWFKLVPADLTCHSEARTAYARIQQICGMQNLLDERFPFSLLTRCSVYVGVGRAQRWRSCGSIAPMGTRNTALAIPSKGVGSAFRITIFAPAALANSTAPAIG
jgi:hypothetical protein